MTHHMRKIMRIVEVAGTLGPEDEHAFLTGECHALAMALHRLTGLPMAAILIRKGRATEVAHVMVGDAGGSSFMDIEGERDLPMILADLEFDSDEETSTVVPADEGTIRRWIRTGKLRPISPEMEEKAMLVARDLLDNFQQ